MNTETEYKLLYGTESWGSSGVIGVKILVAVRHGVDINQEPLRFAAYKAVDLIQDELTAAAIQNDQERLDSAKEEKNKLLALFPQPIFVEEIPNGYCAKACCRHLPWFVVTTKVGRFTIGWRKRVISIEWTQTVGTKDAKTLFGDEGVTAYDKVVHAYSYDKAREYICKIMESVS